jgi:FlaA1/EpsC-like NDP-sugar epimerase
MAWDERIHSAPAGISCADLLDNGPSVLYGPRARELLFGKRILVTGAGGSIGSEIVRQLESLSAGSVYLLDHDESMLHALQLDLRGHGLLDDEHIILGDVRDRAKITRIMRDVQPDIVFHAAAHKHLPLLERYPSEGVKTNVLGTLNVVSAATQNGVGRFINVSTDKAARPTSVLGATKRLAELVVRDHAGQGTRLASVRFGNVLGSRGSFLVSLSFQVAHGEPVTVTSQDASRFFMTIPDAAGLVIEASVMADCGETYVLDMGEPIRIIDLVERYVTLTGVPFPEVRITGLRPGEKLHEELLDGAEKSIPTVHPRISKVIANDRPPAGLRERVDGLYKLTVEGSVSDLLAELRSLLPDAALVGDALVTVPSVEVFARPPMVARTEAGEYVRTI